MIGRFLASLTPEQEDRVLTRTMQKGNYANLDGSACLVGAAGGATLDNTEMMFHAQTRWLDTAPIRQARAFVSSEIDILREKSVEQRFDNLCRRLGVVRAAELVRSRILRNRLRRTLAQAHAVAVVETALPTLAGRS